MSASRPAECLPRCASSPACATGTCGCAHCAEAALSCCNFHGAGGAADQSCGGDFPNAAGRHLRGCAYHAGGDCTCRPGAAAP